MTLIGGAPGSGKTALTMQWAVEGKTRPTAGRFKVFNTFVDVTLRCANPSAAVVWFILFRDTKPDGLARTSQTDLARRADVSVSTVYRALRQLEGQGLLIVVRKGRLGTGGTVYRVRATGDG